MGWILFLFILVIINIPLFIPFVIRAKWDGKSMPTASVHYGKILIYPQKTKESEENDEKETGKSGSLIKKLLPVLNGIKIGLGYVFKVLFILTKSLVTIIKSPLILIKKIKNKSQTEEDDYQDNTPEQYEARTEIPLDSEEGSPDYDQVTNQQDIEEESENITTEAGETSEAIADKEILPDIDEALSEIEAEKKKVQEQFSQSFGSEILEDDSKDKSQKRENRLSGLFRKWEKLKNLYAKLQSLYAKGKWYYDQLGPLSIKILKAVQKLVIRCSRAFVFKVFVFRIEAGGDPAVMGQALGWYHALGGISNGFITRHIDYEPDFDNHEFALQGKADLNLRIYMYRFILPFMIFLFSIPYLEAWRAIKNIRKDSKNE